MLGTWDPQTTQGTEWEVCKCLHTIYCMSIGADGLNPQKGWRPEGKSHCGVYFSCTIYVFCVYLMYWTGCKIMYFF